jgi:PPOX class probable F420-dependent enzyme
VASEEDRAYAEERLQTEVIVWLSTVRADGQPQSSPVWFMWDDGAFLIWSLPGSQKVPNIRANPRVSLHLEGDGRGGGIVTFEGMAELNDRSLLEVPDYVAKYTELVRALGTEPEPFAQAYSVGIRVTPTRLRVYR